MSCVDTDLREEVGDRANIILLAPTFGSGAERWCEALLAPGAGEDGAVIYVSDARAPDSFIEDWRARSAPLPPQLGIVTFGSTLRSNGEAGPPEAELGDSDVRLRNVDSPGNLTKLGVELNQMLTDWAATAEDTTICFESLTSMIQYGDIEKVYRFLHVFSNQVRKTGATVHYHLDPTAHDATDVNLLKTTCDAVVEPTEDGGAEVQTR